MGQLADLDKGETERWGRQFDEGARDLSREGLLAQATDENGNLRGHRGVPLEGLLA